VLIGAARAEDNRSVTGRILPDRATSTCIGRANTPSCAAETLLACFQRGDPALCQHIGLHGVPSDSSLRQQVEYAIERTSVIRAEDITDDTRDLDWYKPGYSLVELGRRSCAADLPSCEDINWEDMQVYLKPVENRFEVVTWRGETDPDTAPEIPDNFQRPDPATP
jgi:hypothetical protein